ncbi:hypothetical protein E3P77_02268 [Wallemia ichthyophaga]|nr:hypothetical protein E3P77_02268 [Wallemia ichthyophaga]
MDYYTTCSTLLKAFWVLGPFALFYDAPFGRFGDGASRFSLNGRITWFIMELLSPLSFVAAVGTSVSTPLNTLQTTATALFLAHYLNRAVIYPLLSPSSSPSHLLVLVSAATFNIANGSLQGKYIAELDVFNGFGRIGVFGILLTLLGFAGNVYHDSILFKIKRECNGGYEIPQHGLFKHISYPNYFCEWIEWSGYALFTHSKSTKDPPIMFIIALLATMAPRAYKGHQWYKSNFKYPESRKIVIPWLF